MSDIVDRLDRLAEAIGGTVLGGPALIAEAQHAIRLLRKTVDTERDACARIASGMADGTDCNERGAMDMETGDVPCGAERRGDVCVCAERYELAFKIADKIRARSTSAQ